MKINNLKFLIAIFSVSLFFGACEKENNVTSKATFFPIITVNGDETIIHPVGTTYTDASAVVTVGGAAYPFETDGTVDDSELGWYVITYTAVNEDGFSASKSRLVVVVDPAALAEDLTGSFRRSGQAGTVINWNKSGVDHEYLANNPGGVPPSNASYAFFNATFVAYHVAPGVIVVPLQVAGGLAPFFVTVPFAGSQLIAFNSAAAVGETGYAYHLNGANFGTQLRTFIKL